MATEQKQWNSFESMTRTDYYLPEIAFVTCFWHRLWSTHTHRYCAACTTMNFINCAFPVPFPSVIASQCIKALLNYFFYRITISFGGTDNEPSRLLNYVSRNALYARHQLSGTLSLNMKFQTPHASPCWRISNWRTHDQYRLNYILFNKEI